MRPISNMARALLFTLLSFHSVQAQDRADAIELFRSEVYTEAARIFRVLADQGDHESQYFMGLAYRSGLGVESDQLMAMFYFIASSKSGDVNFAFEVGKQILDNQDELWNYIGLAEDPLKRASTAGHSEAQLYLSKFYTSVRIDLTTALMWAMVSDHNGAQGAKEAVGALEMLMSPHQYKVSGARARYCMSTKFVECFEGLENGTSVQAIDCSFGEIVPIMNEPSEITCIFANKSSSAIDSIRYRVFGYIQERSKPILQSMTVDQEIRLGLEPNEVIQLDFPVPPGDSNLIGSEDAQQIIADFQIIYAYDQNGRAVLPRQN